MNKFVILHIDNQQNTTMKKAFLILLLMVFFINTTTAQLIRSTDRTITFSASLKEKYARGTNKSDREIIEETIKVVLKVSPLENAKEKMIITVGGKETEYIIKEIVLMQMEDDKPFAYRLYLKDTNLIVLFIDYKIVPSLAITREDSDVMEEYLFIGEDRSKFLASFNRLQLYVDTVLDGDYRYPVCSYCYGTGICSNCRGKKVVEDMFESGTCGTCNGTGECKECHGKGHK